MRSASVLPRWLLLGGAAAGLAALGVTQVAAGHVANVPAPAPVQAVMETVASHQASVSADGRFVAYAGAPTGAGDTRASTIFLKDRSNGSVVEISPVLPSVARGDSVWPVISGDGCSVTFLTQMPYDLFRDDDQNLRWDVYRQVLPACGGTLGDLELVSATSSDGFQASAADDVVPTDRPAVSVDGTMVAYTHQFSVTTPDLTGVIVVDLTVPIGDPGRAVSVAGTPTASPDSTFSHHGLGQPSLSSDGSIVGFTSDADSATPAPTWGSGPARGGPATTNVYVWDRTNPDPATRVRVVSVAKHVSTGSADSPSVSGDGRFVAFVSTATNLVPGAVLPACTPDCVPEVYLFDRNDGSVRLVSRVSGDPAAAPVAADAGGSQPVLGASDDEVVFVSRSTNLFATRSGGVGAADDGDIVVMFPTSGRVQRVSVLADGVTPAPAANSHPRMSATGRVVVFDTLAGPAFGSAPIDGRQVAVVDHAPKVDLANLDVGAVSVGFASPEWYVVLNNLGPSSFVPATITTSDPDFMVSGGSCVDNAGFGVPPGGSCTVQLMLIPSAPGAHSASLTVAEAGYNATSVTATLTGTGGDPTLTAVAAAGDGFGGSLVVGATGTPMPLSFQNVTAGTVRINKVRIVGDDPQDFTVAADQCSARKLAANATCALQVVFHPTAAGRRSATVVAVTSAGIYASILVSGSGHYAPTLVTDGPTVVTGSRLSLSGKGFSPSTKVTIAWADGSGRSASVTTDANGAFTVAVLVRATDHTGVRTLVAQTVDGQVAKVVVKVVAKSTTFGPDAPAWPGA